MAYRFRQAIWETALLQPLATTRRQVQIDPSNWACLVDELRDSHAPNHQSPWSTEVLTPRGPGAD